MSDIDNFELMARNAVNDWKHEHCPDTMERRYSADGVPFAVELEVVEHEDEPTERLHLYIHPVLRDAGDPNTDRVDYDRVAFTWERPLSDISDPGNGAGRPDQPPEAPPSPEFGDEYVIVAVRADRMDRVRELLGNEDAGNALLSAGVPAYCPCDSVSEAVYVETDSSFEHHFACTSCADEMRADMNGQLYA